MKKLFVLLLAVFVLSSVAMIAIACGGDEETTTTVMEETTVPEDVTTTEAASTAITPAEAAALGAELLAKYQEAGSPEDKTAFVVPDIDVAGTVFAVKDKGTFAIVSLGDETTPFNILVPYEVFQAAGLTLDDLNTWIGSDIEVMGAIVVNDWGSMTEMQLTDLSQVVLP